MSVGPQDPISTRVWPRSPSRVTDEHPLDELKIAIHIFFVVYVKKILRLCKVEEEVDTHIDWPLKARSVFHGRLGWLFFCVWKKKRRESGREGRMKRLRVWGALVHSLFLPPPRTNRPRVRGALDHSASVFAAASATLAPTALHSPHHHHLCQFRPRCHHHYHCRPVFSGRFGWLSLL